MGAAAGTLIPPFMRGSTGAAPKKLAGLNDLLARARTVKLKEIRRLSRFVPVIVLIPEPSVHNESVQDKIAPNCPLSEIREPGKILGTLSRATEQFRTPRLECEFLFGHISVNLHETSVCRDGEPVVLTTMEFKVLTYLVRNARRVISRHELLKEVWGFQNYPRTRTVDNHILRLRQKLEQDPAQPVHIRTVHGAGYKFLP